MRIIARPFLDTSLAKRGLTLIPLDIGTRPGPEVAEKIGIRWPTLRERLRRQGWRRVDILEKIQEKW